MARPPSGYVLAFGLLAVSVGVSFVVLLLGPVAAQRDPVILDSWASAFPDWNRPWRLPVWMIAETLEVGRYVCKPLGQGIMVLAIAGGVRWWCAGRRGHVVLLGLPVALAMLAALLHRYPYGGYRVMAFAVPAVLLLAASAVPPVLAWLGAWHRLAAGGFVCFLLMPAAVAVQRMIWVWPVADNAGVAAFVEARRQANESVIGNDWTQMYYFRQLSGAFHLATEPVRLDDRVWVVFTGTLPAEAVWGGVLRTAPPGWRVVRRFESLYAAAGLFERPPGPEPDPSGNGGVLIAP